jgi:hypothetical protein
MMAGDVNDGEIRAIKIYRDFDSVVTKVTVESEGQTLLAGSQGNVIDASPVKDHYVVGFLPPFLTAVFFDEADLDPSN